MIYTLDFSVVTALARDTDRFVWMKRGVPSGMCSTLLVTLDGELIPREAVYGERTSPTGVPDICVATLAVVVIDISPCEEGLQVA